MQLVIPNGGLSGLAALAWLPFALYYAFNMIRQAFHAFVHGCLLLSCGLAGCIRPSGQVQVVPPDRPVRANGSVREYECPRAPGVVTIDGAIDEREWQPAAWTGAFVDIEGDKRPLPRFATQARMMWDDQFFYVAARMQEPHVWATLTQRDSVIFHDNDFEVFIDPNGDGKTYFEFEINALNTGWDLYLPRTYIDKGKPDNGWNMDGMRSAVHIDGTLNNPADTDAGWTVELALPWKSFAPHAGTRAPPGVGDAWRVNFSRVQWRHHIVQGRYEKVPLKESREDNWVWSPQGVVDMHRPAMWGVVRFGR